MKLNFGEAAKAKETGRYIVAGIKDATFQGIEKGVVKGKDGSEYDVMSMKLDLDGYGEYTQNFFEPQSDERAEMSWGLSASQADHFMVTVIQILEALDASIVEKINRGEISFSGSFSNIVKKIKELTTPYIGNAVQVKFIPGNNGYNSMPSFPAKITSSGTLGIATYIIKASNLTLTPSEVKKIDAAKNATPTNMTAAAASNALGKMAADLGVDSSDDDDDLPFA